MHILERAHAYHRAWRYRLRTERQELGYLLGCDLRGATVADVGANRGVYSYYVFLPRERAEAYSRGSLPNQNATSKEGTMRKAGWGLSAALAAMATVCGEVSIAVAAEPKVIATPPQKMGNGSARVYVALDANGRALALGVSLDKGVLEGLPKEPNNTSRCFDKNGNGKMDEHECIGDYNVTFALPEGEAAKAVAPFKWVSLNWNPHGHIPPAPPPWAVPHFDFHFYIQEREAVRLIRPGKCGELIDCEDFKKATKAVPTKYLHRDHINVDAAVPDMGNHLINSKSPELAPKGPPFTHTFIFGAYDGRITFLEPMITHAYLASNPNMCAPIKQPEAWEAAGFYPAKYCIRYLERAGRYTVSLEGFVAQPAR